MISGLRQSHKAQAVLVGGHPSAPLTRAVRQSIRTIG